MVQVFERASFKVALPYPTDRTIDEPPEKPLHIPIDYKEAMQRLHCSARSCRLVKCA